MSHNVFKNTVIDEFNFLKKLNSNVLSSEIKLLSGGFLLPITYQCLEDNDLINNLLSWREQNEFAYPSRGKTNFNKTKLWLEKNVLDNPTKILFKIYNKNFKMIGHIGLFINDDFGSKIEIDNVLRGIKNSDKGIISESLKAIIKWAQSVFLPEGFLLRVLKSNPHAIQFYKNNNFDSFDEYSLYRIENDFGYNLVKFEERFKNNKIADHFLLMEPNKEKVGDKLILTAGPSIGSRERIYAADAALNGWNSKWSHYLNKFENKFAEYIGVKYAIATSSCTGALHISLLALGIKEGDEVIVPDITWVSTANSVLLVGATPVFADVNEKTWTIDPLSIENKITKKTKAIIPVHLYGHPCEMDEILEISKKYNLKVIEDAAPSIGAEYKGQRTGSFGDFAAFSFQGAKLLVTGEGGMLCTNNEELYKKAYKIWDQGRIPGSFWIEELGVKYKMSNIQAALGFGQLYRNDLMVMAKRRINSWYFERLKGLRQIDFWQEGSDVKSICWMTSIRLNENSKLDRVAFCNKLKEFNIDSRPVFPTISQYPYWPKKQDKQKQSTLIADTGINLPSGVCLLKEEVDYICDKIILILNE
ncbi:aminotransferase class I/II-fold pyridoxal phosphate-dependent enzyme [Flavobacteriaceae bacterium]|nr:aminotransferase class I/II-fold pyridoxal phosphate-dependent enzyme [Flavobacteriaceae bacterium]